jgi:hypothetical protein
MTPGAKLGSFETPHCNVRHCWAEIETIYAAYQVLLLKLGCSEVERQLRHQARTVLPQVCQNVLNCSGVRHGVYGVSGMAEYGKNSRYLGQIT